MMPALPGSAMYVTAPRHSAPHDGTSEAGGWRARWRRYAAAWMLGGAVVIAPAWPSAAQERSARRPPFERALSWRDFIRLRLSPWLLIQQSSTPADGLQADAFRADEFDADQQTS